MLYNHQGKQKSGDRKNEKEAFIKTIKYQWEGKGWYWNGEKYINFKISNICNIYGPEVKKENSSEGDICKMITVIQAIEWKKVVWCKNHRTYQAGKKDYTIMISELKEKTQNGHNNRSDYIQ